MPAGSFRAGDSDASIMTNHLSNRRERARAWRALAGGGAAALTLAGCASFSPDGGFDRVAQLTRERTGQPVAWQRTPSQTEAAQARVAELQKQPLTADTAVELAFLNNRNLQADFAALGLAEADLVRAGRLANPTFTFSRIAGGGLTEIDRSLVFSVLGLLTMPVATQLEQGRFEQAQLQAATDAVALAGETRRAFFSAVAAQDLATYALQVLDAAEASSELARRMRQAGNFSPLAQLRQQAFHAEATTLLARARQQASAQRERLVRLLGWTGDASALKLPERLPDLPAKPNDLVEVERTAMDQRLDLRMARLSVEASARDLGLNRATGLVNVLNAGYVNKSQTGEARQNGYTIELELPLFDAGSTRSARAEAAHQQAVDRAAALEINARSELRESYSAYRTAFELARHYRDEVVPLHQRISDETLLRYNGMLTSVFELLADSRDQVASVTGYVEALRDYWIAESELRSALSGVSPSAGTPGARSVGTESAH
jgi:outer membrane protein TolC